MQKTIIFSFLGSKTRTFMEKVIFYFIRISGKKSVRVPTQPAFNDLENFFDFFRVVVSKYYLKNIIKPNDFKNFL